MNTYYWIGFAIILFCVSCVCFFIGSISNNANTRNRVESNQDRIYYRTQQQQPTKTTNTNTTSKKMSSNSSSTMSLTYFTFEQLRKDMSQNDLRQFTIKENFDGTVTMTRSDSSSLNLRYENGKWKIKEAPKGPNELDIIGQVFTN